MDRAVVSEAAGSNAKRKRRKKGGLKTFRQDGSWHVTGTLRIDGRPIRVRKSLGLPAERPEHEAEAARLRLETQLVTEAVYGIKPSATFSMVTLTWLNTAQPGAADVRMSKALVRRFGAKTVREISAADVGAFVASLGNRKPATVNRYLNPLHAILATGVRLGFAETVPHFERPRIKKARINKMLSMDEIDILFDGLAPHAADIVALLGTSGCRVSEAIYLQIPDVILAPGRERVLFRDTKNGESYNAALHPFAIPYLVRAIGDATGGSCIPYTARIAVPGEDGRRRADQNRMAHGSRASGCGPERGRPARARQGNGDSYTPLVAAYLRQSFDGAR